MQALISAILPVIIFIMMLFVPESPRYLIQKGKTLEATSALLRFRGACIKEQVDPELRVVSSLHVTAKSSLILTFLTRLLLHLCSSE